MVSEIHSATHYLFAQLLKDLLALGIHERVAVSEAVAQEGEDILLAHLRPATPSAGVSAFTAFSSGGLLSG
jgi:hypothetical protein